MKYISPITENLKAVPYIQALVDFTYIVVKLKQTNKQKDHYHETNKKVNVTKSGDHIIILSFKKYLHW